MPSFEGLLLGSALLAALWLVFIPWLENHGVLAFITYWGLFGVAVVTLGVLTVMVIL